MFVLFVFRVLKLFNQEALKFKILGNHGSVPKCKRNLVCFSFSLTFPAAWLLRK
jgi:hypothetical protein